MSSANRTYHTQAEILGLTVNTTLLVIQGLQGCVAIITNLITIIAVAKYTFLKEEPMSRFVVSLGCADLLGGLAAFIDITLDSDLQLNSTPWLVLHVLCMTKWCLHFFSLLGNIFNSLFVTVDRLIYIILPMRYVSIVTTFRASVSILFLWLVVAVHTILVVTFHYDVITDMNNCLVLGDLRKMWMYIIITEYLLIVFGIIIPCYCKIILTIRHLRQTEPHLSHYPPDQQENQRQKIKQHKLAVTMGWVLGTFIICNIIPVISNSVVKLFDFDPLSFNAMLSFRIAKLIFWTQSMLNIFIYGWKNKTFRKAYKKLFHISEANGFNW